MTQNKPLRRLMSVFILMTVLILIQNSNAIFGSYTWSNKYLEYVNGSWKEATGVTPFKEYIHSGGIDIITGFFGFKSWQSFGLLVLVVWAMKWTWQKGKATGSFTRMILAGIKWAVVVGFIGGMLTEWHAMETVTSIKTDGATASSIFYHAPWVEGWYSWAGRFATTWTNTLQLIVVPTVFFAIVALLVRFGKDKNTKSFFVKGFAYLTIGAGIASAIAFLIGLPFLGWMKGLPFGNESGTTAANNLNTILGGFFPSNLTQAFSNANSIIVPIILFALAFGGFAVKMSGWGKDYEEASHSIEKFALGGNKIFNTLLDYTIGLLPLAIIALLSRAIIRFGNIELLTSLAGYIVYVYAALAAVYVISTLFTAFVTKTSPFRVAKNGLKAVMTGFFTQSSLGTLPVSIKTAKEAGNSDRGSEVIPTMATTMGAWGCAGVYPTAVVMALVAAGAVELNVTLVIMTIIVTMFASIGIAGVPGVAGIAVGIVLAGIGKSEFYALFFALLYPLESLVDMGRTAINVHAGQVVTALVETENNTMDWNTYRGTKGGFFSRFGKKKSTGVFVNVAAGEIETDAKPSAKKQAKKVVAKKQAKADMSSFEKEIGHKPNPKKQTKAPAKKAAPKKEVAKKAPAKKAEPKKEVAKKPAAKKPAAKKAAPKKK